MRLVFISPTVVLTVIGEDCCGHPERRCTIDPMDIDDNASWRTLPGGVPSVCYPEGCKFESYVRSQYCSSEFQRSSLPENRGAGLKHEDYPSVLIRPWAVPNLASSFAVFERIASSRSTGWAYDEAWQGHRRGVCCLGVSGWHAWWVDACRERGALSWPARSAWKSSSVHRGGQSAEIANYRCFVGGENTELGHHMMTRSSPANIPSRTKARSRPRGPGEGQRGTKAPRNQSREVPTRG